MKYELLAICGLAITSYIGVFIRIGCAYLKVWRIETNYSVMYA